MGSLFNKSQVTSTLPEEKIIIPEKILLFPKIYNKLQTEFI